MKIRVMGERSIENGLTVKAGGTFITCRYCFKTIQWLDFELDQDKSYEKDVLKIPVDWHCIIKSGIAGLHDEYWVCQNCYIKDLDYCTL